MWLSGFWNRGFHFGAMPGEVLRAQSLQGSAEKDGGWLNWGGGWAPDFGDAGTCLWQLAKKSCWKAIHGRCGTMWDPGRPFFPFPSSNQSPLGKRRCFYSGELLHVGVIMRNLFSRHRFPSLGTPQNAGQKGANIKHQSNGKAFARPRFLFPVPLTSGRS